MKAVDNSGANHLGYIPRDSSEPFRARIEAAKPPGDPRAPVATDLGGWFCERGHPDDTGQ